MNLNRIEQNYIRGKTMSLNLPSQLLGTQPAIETLEALKIISLIGLAAIAGPLIIGGLFYLMKKTNKGIN